MAGNTSNTLAATITAQDDATQNVPINFGTGNPTFDSTVAELTRYYALPGGTNALSLPKSPATQVYIKNIDAAKTVTVAWTPNGGASNNIILLNPGDQIILWCNPAGATTPGITAISFTPSVAGCLIEFFFGG